VNASSSEMTQTATVGTADWIEVSRGIMIAAYVPGDATTADAPRPLDGAAAENPNAAETDSLS
jgi:hypothetical protein